MRVSWETNCTAESIKFTLEMYGSRGWMAIGLHDAGSANLVTDLPSTRMHGADIVQVNPSTGALRDAYGNDYMTPPEKASPTAVLAAAEVASGRMSASFTRPFAASQGTSLAADRFVWLLCAYRSSSDDMGAKHNQATALSRARISLFGGVAESQRYVYGAAGQGATSASISQSVGSSGPEVQDECAARSPSPNVATPGSTGSSIGAGGASPSSGAGGGEESQDSEETPAQAGVASVSTSGATIHKSLFMACVGLAPVFRV